MAVCFLFPGTAEAQLGGGEEEESEEEEVSVLTEFRVGGGLGAVVKTPPGIDTQGGFGGSVRIDPVNWPVLFSAEGNAGFGDPGENNWISANAIVEIGSRDNAVVPYFGAGVGYFQFEGERREFGISINVDQAGLNLKSGIEIPIKNVVPFLEAEYIGGDESIVSVEGGVLLVI
jgi:hypothetical protein